MTFMKISFDLIKKRKVLISILILFLIIIIVVFSLLKKNDAETSLPYEENITQDNDLLATKEKIEKIDEKKGSQQIIKEKLDEKQKTVIDNKAKEVKVPKKVAKKKNKRKNLQEKKCSTNNIQASRGLKKN